jgi:CRISPR-associated endonuclease/helicase Cas3
VNIYNYEFGGLMQRGVIEEVFPQIYALASNLDYSENTGLQVKETTYDPEQFIV